jgi:hypothetical protein
LQRSEEALRKTATEAPEGIASIAVDGWAVDYVRLDPGGHPLHDPFCYRDERTIAAKHKADALLPPEEAFRRTGAQPLRINTLYQLLADAEGEQRAPWLCLPEFVLHWLGDAFDALRGDHPVQATANRVGIFLHVLHECVVDLFVHGVHFLVARNDGAGGGGILVHKRVERDLEHFERERGDARQIQIQFYRRFLAQITRAFGDF